MDQLTAPLVGEGLDEKQAAAGLVVRGRCAEGGSGAGGVRDDDPCGLFAGAGDGGADQVAGMPEVLASGVRELVAEYEAKESAEAICARDADKLECMIQGIEYKAQGYENAQRWIDNSRGRLTTKSANELADAVLATGSLDWLRTALGERQSRPTP
ncbi:HD domain-containing protein [Streptomyces flaveus]|uniref:HD domain-containing protein n=1 Tax=Streptomyces flaveus TaxID=66370 RepID=UPI001FE80A6E|nr:HD domain-containing protein [Streptomyces flaveus]